MILLTRLNGLPFALNPALIERVDSCPDTVVTLSDGAKYVVREKLGELIELTVRHAAQVQALATLLAQRGEVEHFPTTPDCRPAAERQLRAVTPQEG